MSVAYAAVVLAGGGSRRMGTDKLAERVGGVPLLERVLSACTQASSVVVVGAPRTLVCASRQVVWAREEPPGGGPVPALAAGLCAVPPGFAYAVVLAGDLPFVTPDDMALLLSALEAAPAAAGAVALDAEGREQGLLSAWRVAELRARLSEAAVPDGLAGLPLHRTLAPLRRVRVHLPNRDDPGWVDLDTPEELAAARERGGGR